MWRGDGVEVAELELGELEPVAREPEQLLVPRLLGDLQCLPPLRERALEREPVGVEDRQPREGKDLGPGVVERAGDGERLLAQRDRVGVAAVPLQREMGEDLELGLAIARRARPVERGLQLRRPSSGFPV